MRRQDSHADQRKLKPTASAGGSDPARRPKASPPNGGKATSRFRTEEEHRPDLRQVTEREDQEHHRTKESRGTAAPLGQANKYLTKNQGNNLHSEATEGGQPRINPNHLKPSANTGSEREEPKVKFQENSRRLDHQTPGTAQRKTRTREGKYLQKKVGT